MADQFIGLWVLVTFKDQSGNDSQVTGIIRDITSTRDLLLSNVHSLKENYHLPSIIITLQSLVNVEVIPALAELACPPPPVASTSASNTYVQTTSIVQAASVPIHSQPAPFIDPAIVSFSRAPTSHVPPPNEPPAAPTQPPLSSSFDLVQVRSMSPAENQKPFAAVPPPPLSRKPSSMGIPMQKNPSTAQSYQAEKLSRKLSISREKGSPVRSIQASMVDMNLRGDAGESSCFDETDDALSGLPASTNFAHSGKRSRRGKAYRVEQHQKFSGGLSSNGFGGNYIAPSRPSGRKPRSKRHQSNAADEEGWATEDINDIRDIEFDFQKNLDRFDKKSIFSQIRAEDTTADEARLVSFNRLPQRPSSSKAAGVRKNYKPTENVLETYANGQSLAERDSWNKTPKIGTNSSESDVFDRDRGRDPTEGSGRNSRRAISRPSHKQRPLSKPLISAASSSAVTLHQNSSSGDLANGQEASRGILKMAINSRSGHSLDQDKSRPCPTVHPLQMIDVETIAESEIGLDNLLITENAARGIATVAIQAFGTRLNPSNHNPLPVVLVFAGNNKAGARAIAAGRHLKNHHVRVFACIVGLEREDELLGDIKKQLKIFKQVGGRVASLEELTNIVKTLDSPPELIIDGILGINKTFDELRTDDQAVAFQLVRFANKSNACVLSIDIPCGIDPRTGEISRLEDNGPFYIRAKWVVALGAPKTGLLHALDSGVGSGWKLLVADIGIPSAAWRKYGSRRRHGVEFCADWVVPLDYYSPH